MKIINHFLNLFKGDHSIKDVINKTQIQNYTEQINKKQDEDYYTQFTLQWFWMNF